MKVRDSNYELLRIISMFLIVFWHTILHGRLLENTDGILKFMFYLIMIICVVHVNTFILITGYYQSKSQFKLKKVFLLIAEVFFYNLVINSIFKFTGLIEYTNIEFIKQISPLNLESYWFVSCYIIVYLLSPYINSFIEQSSRKNLKKIIYLMIGFVSLLPFLSDNLFYRHEQYSIIHFIFFYFIGAYIRKYELNSSFLSDINIYQRRICYIIVFLTCIVFNFSIHFLQLYMNELDSNILQFIASALNDFTLAYNNPLVVIQSLSLFMLFGTFQFKCKHINQISSLTLGVYLIHENCYMRSNLYRWLNIDKGHMLYGKSILLSVLGKVILIFVTCLLIEKIRKCSFNALNKLHCIQTFKSKIHILINKVLEVK